MPYSLDLKKKIVAAYEAGKTSIRKVAKHFMVNQKTVERLVNQLTNHSRSGLIITAILIGISAYGIDTIADRLLLGNISGRGYESLATVRTQVLKMPVGASLAGYTKRIINEHPIAIEIENTNSSGHKWYNGTWFNDTPYTQKPRLNVYSTTSDNVLKVDAGGRLMSVSPILVPGTLPLLPGKDGFYIEYEYRLSNNHPDHFSAVWLLPFEWKYSSGDGWGSGGLGPTQPKTSRLNSLDAYYPDLYPDDPLGYTRYMELDVDESGFGPGLTGTIHSWGSINTNNIADGAFNLQNPNKVSPNALDRTQYHKFGASYNPINQTVSWYLDDIFQFTGIAPAVPLVGKRQNFYLLIWNQTHGANVPYSMYIKSVRAYTTRTSTIPEV